jgi:putative holliday junction resolvase
MISLIFLLMIAYDESKVEKNVLTFVSNLIMGRILAIDYGKKRVGLAVTDELKIIATSLGTVAAADIMDYLKNYTTGHQVECIVVGEPRDLANHHSESEVYIQPFLKQLAKAFPSIPVVRYDERFTSKMASQAILLSGVNKKQRQNKALVDSVSATIILQSYMEAHHPTI